MEDLQQKLEQQQEWSSAVIFDQTLKIISKMKSETTSDELRAYQDRECTLHQGIIYQGDHFDIHRFHPPLIYGRTSKQDLKEGICLSKGTSQRGEPIYMLITYDLPINSARAIPQMIEFFNKNVGTMDRLYSQQIYIMQDVETIKKNLMDQFKERLKVPLMDRV